MVHPIMLKILILRLLIIATLYLAQANSATAIRLINRLLFQTFWRIKTLLQF